MASKAPPPLIRSSKAFSVEIPEGSNSAKSRRSDVVPNDDLDIHKSSSNFQSEEAHSNLSQGFHADDTLGLSSAFGEDHADHAKGQFNDHQDELKDRFATDQDDGAHAANMVSEDHDHPENLAKLPSEDSPVPLKGMNVARDAINDNVQGIANEGLHDKLVGVGNEAIHDKLAGVGNEAIHDKLVGVGNEAIHDKLAGAPNESIKDNLQGVANAAEQDRLVGIPQEAIQDNMQGLGNEALQDNHAGIPKEGIEDRHVGVAKEAMEDHHLGVGKEHLEDHIAQLPPANRMLADGPKPGVQPTHVSGGAAVKDEPSAKHPKQASPSAAPLDRNAEEAVAHAEALLHAQQEKAKRMEEFHGRVDAIRKTVSSINHKLDELDEDGAPIKH